MGVPQAIRISRKHRGLSQTQMDVPYSQQMLSAIENGARDLASDMAPLLAAKLDHPALLAELARELTGFGPSWLDGPNVDLHRAAVREKALEELREAMQCIDKFVAYVPPAAETEQSRRARYGHLLQVYDAMVATFTYIGTQCLEYDYSMLQLSRDHHNKLKGKRYVMS